MYEKITNLKKKIQDMKKSRLQTVYNQIFKFKPFSKKQKQVLTWWCATSPVKDYDGIIADGAIRSGKTVCMSLSYVMWAMETFNGQNFAMCGKTIGSFRRNVLFWLKLMLKARDAHFVMDDNLSLSEKIKERYRNTYRGVFYKRYILGLWAMAEGVIYDMFDNEKHVEDPNAFQTKLINSNRYVSCDYGTQNATVFLLWNKGTDGVWYCTREYYYSGRDKGRQKTDAEYAKDLESWLDGTEIKAVIVDPAAASFIAELRKRGFRVIKAKNDVEDGIRLVSTKLNLIKIIFSNVCQNTIKEFASYIWDAKAAERGEDKPIKQYDHAMDAVRYFVYTIFGDKPRLNRNLKGGL